MGKATTKRKASKAEVDEEKNDSDVLLSGEAATHSHSKITKSATVKRDFEDDEDDSDQECDENAYSMGNEMSSMIKKFGVDMKKSITAKRKRLESLTAQSATSCKAKVDTILDNQKKDRQTLMSEYSKQMNCVFGQWEADITKVKENEDKLNAVLQQQMKLIAQIRVVQTQRFKSLKQLQEQFLKSMEDIEQNHAQQKSSVCYNLKEEMSKLQAKILKDTQAQEMASMRQNLHSMLFK